MANTLPQTMKAKTTQGFLNGWFVNLITFEQLQQTRLRSAFLNTAVWLNIRLNLNYQNRKKSWISSPYYCLKCDMISCCSSITEVSSRCKTKKSHIQIDMGPIWSDISLNEKLGRTSHWEDILSLITCCESEKRMSKDENTSQLNMIAPFQLCMVDYSH